MENNSIADTLLIEVLKEARIREEMLKIQDVPVFKNTHPDKHYFGTEQKKVRKKNNRKKKSKR